MNKLLTVCAALAIITCGSVSAQKKGEVSIGGIIGVSGGIFKCQIGGEWNAGINLFQRRGRVRLVFR